MLKPLFPCGRTRREFLWQAGNGFFGTAMAWMLAQDGVFGAEQSPAAAGKSLWAGPHHPPQAKSCIFLFMTGGPSQFDTFDPKPELVKRHGEKHDFQASVRITQRPQGILMGSPFKFLPSGESGIPISELLPRLATCADDMAVMRSTCADSTTHGSACIQMNTGFIRNGFPSLGAWTTYGLGTANAGLPAFVVVGKSPVFGRDQNWSAGFLPSQFQGAVIEASSRAAPIANLTSAGKLSLQQQRYQLDFLARLNERHRERDPLHPDLAARIANYELAYRMQSAAPEAVDFSQETKETLAMYGVGGKRTDQFGTKCLLARRLVERGVRFALLFHPPQNSAGNTWDTHDGNDDRHKKLCGQVDQPIAALLRDLKQRGLLDETLVVWAGEFGRTPIGVPNAKQGDGRDHHPLSFSTWMAGGGIKGGTVYGASDELGYGVVNGRVHIHDLHATILHQMGLDHERLTYPHQGRDFRLTDVEGRVVNEILL